MPGFSLRQTFAAMLALAAGLSVYRLPDGIWLDLPLSILSFYFVLSLCRHASATRRIMVDNPGLPPEQRWGGRLEILVLLTVASAIIVAWTVGALLAAELVVSLAPPGILIDYAGFWMLPRSLAVLSMLAATGLYSWQAPSKPVRLRQRVFGVLAVAGMLMAIIISWIDRLCITFLVYLAITGVETARSVNVLPPEMNVSTAVRV